jgi:sodium/proline symporter
LLAGGDVSPWLVALSTVATMSSGFMFVGMIGFTYRTGLSSMWMLIGWTIGDYVAWKFLYRRLKETATRRDKVSVLALLRPENATGPRLLAPIAGLVTVFYLAMYAAAQLKAGSTALESTFGTPANLGAIIGAGIVLVYCYSGGIRASIWTDAAQSLVMFGSMATLVCFAAIHVGGPADLLAALDRIDPSLSSIVPPDAGAGLGLYLLGMCLGGFGVVGQPHVLVRSMCIKDERQISQARRYYFLFLIPFYAMAIGVGLHARVLIPELGDAGMSEHALPLLSNSLLPDILIGLMVAGLFSATMSTADSQIIACTSAISQDIQPRWKDSYRASKIATIAVTGVTLTIALWSSDGVFSLVLDAWAVLSCTLGPLFVITLMRWPYTQVQAIVMMAVGFAVSNYWVTSDWAGDVYVNLPGMAAVFLVYGLMTVITRGQKGSRQ